MGVGIIDILIFVIFVVVVIGIGLWQSRGEEIHSEHGARDYFLAGRGLTLLKPLPKPVTLPVNESMDMQTDPRTKIFGILVIILTLTLYAIFW